MTNNVYDFKENAVKYRSKKNKRQTLLRVGALFGALLMFGTFCVSLVYNLL